MIVIPVEMAHRLLRLPTEVTIHDARVVDDKLELLISGQVLDDNGAELDMRGGTWLMHERHGLYEIEPLD